MFDMNRCIIFVCFTAGLATASFFHDSLSGEINCQCVPPHLCADSDDTNTGHGLLDIRFEDDACPNYYEVCCETLISDQIKEEVVEPVKKCGISNMAGVRPRITVNSDITQFGEFPWTVLVLQKDRKSDRNLFICGGSLIHPQVVITAGHCVSVGDAYQIKVRAGEWNIRNTDEPLPHQDNSVKEIVIHTQYKPGILWNDIALLFLTKPYAITDNIGFICLPSLKSTTSTRIESNESIGGCIASGWGKNAFGKSRHSSLLRKVTLPLIPRSKCQTALRNTRLGKFYKLHKSFICAGGEKNRDACKGDGGSPLICPVLGENGRFVQMGIVSWGIGCGADKTPGVYVNIPLFTEWIDKQMQLKNFSTSYYKI